MKHFKKLIDKTSTSLNASLIIALLFTLPAFIGSPHWLSIFTIALIWAIFAISYDIIFGQAGILNFGHTAPFGAAAFVAGYLMYIGLPFILALIMGIISGIAVSVAMGLPVRRVRGVYYAILTLAFAETIRLSIENLSRYLGVSISVSPGYPPIVWSTLFYYFNVVITVLLCISIVLGLISKVTSLSRISIGDLLSALIGVVVAVVVSLGIASILSGQILYKFRIITVNFYYLTLIFFLLSYYLAKRIIYSPVGSVWRAIRENPIRTEVLGYDTYTYSLYALAVSGALAGIAGTLFASVTIINSNTAFSSMNTIIVLLSAILGGAGTLIGPIIGMLIVQILRYILASAPLLSYASMAIIGIIYIIVVLIFPYGIVGTWYFKAIKLRRRIMKILSTRIK